MRKLVWDSSFRRALRKMGGLDGTDCAALVTRHREYEALDLGWVKDAMGEAVLVDGRNVFDLVACAQAGLVYHGVVMNSFYKTIYNLLFLSFYTCYCAAFVVQST